MPEEITGTAPETAPAEVIAAAAAQPEPQQESPEFQVERFTVAATFAPPSANDDARTIDAVWYTGAKVPRFDWRSGEEYDLILDMKGCRMDRLNNGGPVLDSHSAYGVESQLGVVRKAWAKKATGLATIQFSKRDAVTPIWNDVKGGIIQNLSPGMWIYKKIDTTPKGQERREFTATDWEPFEISLVAVAADAATNFMSAAVTPPAPPSVVETQRASAHTKEKPEMETTTQDPGVEARQNEVALAAARDEAVKAERLRAGKIRAMATGPFQVEESFLAALIDEGVSVDTARERIMNKVEAEYRKHPTVPINPPPLRRQRRGGQAARRNGGCVAPEGQPSRVRRDGRKGPGICRAHAGGHGARMPECRRREDARNGPARDRSCGAPGPAWGVRVFRRRHDHQRLPQHPGERRQQDPAPGV